MLKNMGLLSARALAKASSFHGCQSTGFAACCRKYGLDSKTRRLYSTPPSGGSAANSSGVGSLRKAIANSAHGLNALRVGVVFFHVLSQPSNMNIDRSGANVRIGTPYAI